jgi:hypothetical protein
LFCDSLTGKNWNKVFILQEEQMAASSIHILPMHSNDSSEYVETQSIVAKM